MPEQLKFRNNMVSNLIIPRGVHDRKLLEAFYQVPRELFVDINFVRCAYSDCATPAGENRHLLSPGNYALLLQYAKISSDDTVLDIGCGTGYGSAIISHIASAVFCLENRKNLLNTAKSNFNTLGICNTIERHTELLATGDEEYAPYSLIVINGSIESVPDNLFDQISTNGRIMCFIKENEYDGKSMGHAYCFRKSKQGKICSKKLFYAVEPDLYDFSKEDSHEIQT